MPAILSANVTNIYLVRAKAGLTQEEFGALFGVSKGFVSKIENGASAPSDKLRAAIAERFEIADPTWLTRRMDRRRKL